MPDVFEEQFQAGLDLFNSEQFYECHDTIEDIWLQESSDRQPFLQAVIQAAVAFHHFQQGSWGAARSMLRLSLEKLGPYPSCHRGVRVAELRGQLEAWKRWLDAALASGDREGAPGAFPKIERARDETDSSGRPGSDR